VKPHWQPDETPWGRFIYWAERFVSWDGFDASERDYKLVLAKRLDRTRTAVLSDGTDWIGPLKQAFGSPNNLTSWRDHDRFLKWCVADPAAARASLQALWDRNAPLEARIRGFEILLPKGTVSMATAFMSYLLMADPVENPVFRMTPFVKGSS